MITLHLTHDMESDGVYGDSINRMPLTGKSPSAVFASIHGEEGSLLDTIHGHSKAGRSHNKHNRRESFFQYLS